MGVEHATPGMLLVIILLLGPVIYFIRKAAKGGDFYIRRIAGIDAIDEAVGRSAELGRPVMFSTGLTTVNPILYACLGVLYYVSKKSSRYQSKLIVPQVNPEAMAVVEDVVREAYRDAGRIASYDPQCIKFLSESQFAFASGYMGLVHRERIATAFLFGQFAAESLILAEAGQQVGAMQVAASFSPEQVPFFICTCDFTVIGEELFAASAYLSREPVQLGSLMGQDFAKLIFYFVIIVGVAISTINSMYPELGIPNFHEIIQMSYSDLFG